MGNAVVATRFDQSVSVETPLKSNNTITNLHAAKKKILFVSPELADLTIYVIDVAEGEKIPRKGGPGITKSDFLVINKTDLAPYVGASLEVMERDTQRMRPQRPWTFSNLKKGEGLQAVIDFIVERGMLGVRA